MVKGRKIGAQSTFDHPLTAPQTTQQTLLSLLNLPQ